MSPLFPDLHNIGDLSMSPLFPDLHNIGDLSMSPLFPDLHNIGDTNLTFKHELRGHTLPDTVTSMLS
jgi:hypothetical protein